VRPWGARQDIKGWASPDGASFRLGVGRGIGTTGRPIAIGDGELMTPGGGSSSCSTNGILDAIVMWDPVAFHFAQKSDRRKSGTGTVLPVHIADPIGAGDPGPGRCAWPAQRAALQITFCSILADRLPQRPRPLVSPPQPAPDPARRRAWPVHVSHHVCAIIPAQDRPFPVNTPLDHPLSRDPKILPPSDHFSPPGGSRRVRRSQEGVADEEPPHGQAQRIPSHGRPRPTSAFAEFMQSSRLRRRSKFPPPMLTRTTDSSKGKGGKGREMGTGGSAGEQHRTLEQDGAGTDGRWGIGEHGTASYGMRRHGTAWDGADLHRTAWNSPRLDRDGMVRGHSIERHATAWNIMELHRTACNCMGRHRGTWGLASHCIAFRRIHTPAQPQLSQIHAILPPPAAIDIPADDAHPNRRIQHGKGGEGREG
jgi:hypothetical protein